MQSFPAGRRELSQDTLRACFRLSATEEVFADKQIQRRVLLSAISAARWSLAMPCGICLSSISKKPSLTSSSKACLSWHSRRQVFAAATRRDERSLPARLCHAGNARSTFVRVVLYRRHRLQSADQRALSSANDRSKRFVRNAAADRDCALNVQLIVATRFSAAEIRSSRCSSVERLAGPASNREEFGSTTIIKRVPQRPQNSWPSGFAARHF